MSAISRKPKFLSTSTEFVDERKVIVKRVSRMRIELIVKGKETFGKLNERVSTTLEILPGLSFLYIGRKEVNDERTMDEMDVSDGCVIVQKMSPLANLLKPGTLTPSVVSSIVKYVENVEIWKVKRVLTNSFFREIKEVMNLKKENYYPIVPILISIVYRHALRQSPTAILYSRMKECGIVKVLKGECERMLKSGIIEDEKETNKKDTIILAFSLMMHFQVKKSSLCKRITEYLIKMISKCVVESSLLSVGMKAVVALAGLLYCSFLSLSFSYSIFSCSISS
jgi:hypothetical protein